MGNQFTGTEQQLSESLQREYAIQQQPYLIQKVTGHEFTLHKLITNSNEQTQKVIETIELYATSKCGSISQLKQNYHRKSRSYCSDQQNFYFLFYDHGRNTVKKEYLARRYLQQRFTQNEIINIMQSMLCGLREYHYKFQRAYPYFSLESLCIDSQNHRLYVKDPWLLNPVSSNSFTNLILSYPSPQKLQVLYNSKQISFNQFYSDLFSIGMNGLQLYNMDFTDQVYDTKKKQIESNLLHRLIESVNDYKLKKGLKILLQINPHQRNDIYSEWEIKCEQIRKLDNLVQEIDNSKVYQNQKNSKINNYPVPNSGRSISPINHQNNINPIHNSNNYSNRNFIHTDSYYPQQEPVKVVYENNKISQPHRIIFSEPRYVPQIRQNTQIIHYVPQIRQGNIDFRHNNSQVIRHQNEISNIPVHINIVNSRPGPTINSSRVNPKISKAMSSEPELYAYKNIKFQDSTPLLRIPRPDKKHNQFQKIIPKFQYSNLNKSFKKSIIFQDNKRQQSHHHLRAQPIKTQILNKFLIQPFSYLPGQQMKNNTKKPQASHNFKVSMKLKPQNNNQLIGHSSSLKKSANVTFQTERPKSSYNKNIQLTKNWTELSDNKNNYLKNQGNYIANILTNNPKIQPNKNNIIFEHPNLSETRQKSSDYIKNASSSIHQKESMTKEYLNYKETQDNNINSNLTNNNYSNFFNNYNAITNHQSNGFDWQNSNNNYKPNQIEKSHSANIGNYDFNNYNFNEDKLKNVHEYTSKDYNFENSGSITNNHKVDEQKNYHASKYIPYYNPFQEKPTFSKQLYEPVPTYSDKFMNIINKGIDQIKDSPSKDVINHGKQQIIINNNEKTINSQHLKNINNLLVSPIYQWKKQEINQIKDNQLDNEIHLAGQKEEIKDGPISYTQIKNYAQNLFSQENIQSPDHQPISGQFIQVQSPERQINTNKYNSTIVEVNQQTPQGSENSFQGEEEYVVEEYSTGSRYQGFKRNGMRSGRGKFFYNDGGHYQGQWKNNKMHGWGKLYYQGGKLAYQGHWRHDQFHGFGKVYNDNPKTLSSPFDYTNFDLLDDFWTYYEGNLVSDTKEGRGKIKLTNGQTFEGDFHADRIQGFGKYFSMDGNFIQGIWRDSKLIKILNSS